ncbi:DMT family transporter [Actinomadura flavalba]|uniref:DMT family transporter n=1 Tax=Actinomadura flavalba TaxID=1120938 RepID=UPI00035FFF7B|nr:EamA family transporter [Actinomadura flavalba]
MSESTVARPVTRAANTSPSPRSGGTAAILTAACLWGTAGPVSTLAGGSSVAVSSARIVVGGLLLLVLALATARAPLAALLRRGRRGVAVVAVGVGCAAAYQTAYYAAVGRTGVAVATVVSLGSAPAFAGLIVRRGLGGRWLTATGGAVAGCALLVGGGADAGAEPGGVLLALLSGFVYTVYTVITARLIAAGVDDRAVTGALFGGAALVLLPVLAVSGTAWAASGTGLAVTLYLGVVTIAAAYRLFARGLRTTTAATATTLTLAEPAVAALIGLTLLGEHLGAPAVAGLALLTASLVLLALPRRRPRGYPAGPDTRTAG